MAALATLAALVAICFVVVAQHRRAERGPWQAGEEAYAVDPNLVSEVAYETHARKFVANRPGSESAFHLVITDRDGRTIEECSAGPGFSQVLLTLLSIRVERPLSPAEATRLRGPRPSELAKLRITDATSSEPQQYALSVAGPEHSVVLFHQRAGFESSVPRLSIERLEQGCLALGVKKR